MAEVGGAVLGFAVSKLLDEVLVALKHVKDASKNLLKLQNLLELSQQSVGQLCSSVRGKSHPAHKWLTELHKQLEMSRNLATVSGDIHRDIIKRYWTSKESLQLYANIQALLQAASLHQWASQLSNPITFSGADEKMLADVRTALAGVEGLQKIADLSSKGSDILSAISKLELVFSSESSCGSSSSMVSIEPTRIDSTCKVPKPEVTFGGEDVADKLINHLLHEECKKWVGLWGMGGIGKTFTARKVFHDSRVQGHFSGGTFWLTVSKDQTDPMHLLKQLHAAIEGPNSSAQLPNSIEAAKSYLKSRLDRDRVLLVLDDVWSDEMLGNLDVIPESKKSIILVTTRDQQILRKVVSFVKIFEIPRLSPEDSWKLFSYYAFRGRGGVVPLELDAVAKKMVEECRQLPLALEVIGSAMADRELVPAEKASGQTTLRVWERALRRLKDANNAENEYDALYLKLQLSVESLSEHDSRLQDCFFYFAAYEEDANIEIEDLVRMWIGEGLVQGDVKSFLSAEEEGRVLLGTLAAKSMIEVTADGIHCGIHDVLRNLALRNLKWNISEGVEIDALARQCLYAPGSRADKLPEEWTVSATPSSAKRLSLRGNDLKRFPEPEQFDAPHLQVLILSYNESLESLSPRFFGKLSELKVLDLSCTGIKRIPGKLLRRLKSLVLLNLSVCDKLEEVSDSINKLQSLEFLDLSYCHRLQKLPQVNNLTNLKIYRAFVPEGKEEMDVHDGSRPWQSRKPWRMHYRRSNEVVPYVLPPKLKVLKLEFRNSAKYVFDKLSLGLLEELKITYSVRVVGPSVKHSVHSVLAGVVQPHQLKVLEIPSLDYAKQLPDLHTLSLLEDLTATLGDDGGMESWGDDGGMESWGDDGGMESWGDEGAFPSLKSLTIYFPNNIEKMFTFHPGTMPKLESLTLLMFERMEHLPISIVELCTLKSLVIYFFGEFTVLENVEFVVDIFKQPDCFPRLEHLNLFVNKGFVKSYKWPKHILDRQQQGHLNIIIHERWQ